MATKTVFMLDTVTSVKLGYLLRLTSLLLLVFMPINVFVQVYVCACACTCVCAYTNTHKLLQEKHRINSK